MNLVFDADDTLWENNIYFERAFDAFCEFLNHSKLTPAQVEVRWELSGDGAPLNVNVSIKGYTMDAIYRSYTFNGRPSVQFPYVGKFAPTESEP